MGLFYDISIFNLLAKEKFIRIIKRSSKNSEIIELNKNLIEKIVCTREDAWEKNSN